MLTFLSKTVLSISEFGLVVSEQQLGEGAPASASGQQSSSDVAMSSETIPQVPQHDTTVNAAQRGTDDSSETQRRDVSVGIPQTVAIEPRRDIVKIAGVDVSNTSSISVLKAACSFLHVSQSGSRSKLWSRILSTLDKRAIEAECELAVVGRVHASS